MSSSILSRPARLTSAVAESIMTGMSSALNLKITGMVAPSGRLELTMSNLSRTLFVASSMSTPYSNSRVSMEMFSFDWEVRSLRSSTPLRAFSSTFVRLVSISWALAPGYEDMTISTFESNSGYWAIDVLTREKTPRIANAMKTRVVVTGLLTAERIILILLPPLYRPRSGWSCRSRPRSRPPQGLKESHNFRRSAGRW